MIVRYENCQKELPEGMTVQECLKALDAFPRGTLAALKGGAAAELNDPVAEDCSLTPLTLEHEEGRRIYERSLRFVMLLALKAFEGAIGAGESDFVETGAKNMR